MSTPVTVDAARGVAIVACVVCMLLTCACEPKRATPAVGTQANVHDNGDEPHAHANVWRSTPVSVRVYPSTRFVDDQGKATLLARIELTDELADSTKGAGDVRLELYAASGADITTVGQHLYTWHVPLNTLEDQRRHYDSITRTYLFRLHLRDEVAAKMGTVLVVTFTEPNGHRLTDRVLISPDGKMTIPMDVTP